MAAITMRVVQWSSDFRITFCVSSATPNDRTIPSCWFHHIGGVHQRGYEKSRLACRGVVLIERFVDVG
jgi:hypothetical protein